MARICDFCERGTVAGQNVPRKGLPRKKGGGGVKIGVRTKRIFKVNLHSKVLYENGIKKKVRICTRCLRTYYKDSV
ncbi:MAG: 50S ribosomal protein L28 [Spirochaetales bacterium]|nr:50S ribosomal protein L28 [Spirochaetales bacterium]